MEKSITLAVFFFKLYLDKAAFKLEKECLNTKRERFFCK